GGGVRGGSSTCRTAGIAIARRIRPPAPPATRRSPTGCCSARIRTASAARRSTRRCRSRAWIRRADTQAQLPTSNGPTPNSQARDRRFNVKLGSWKLAPWELEVGLFHLEVHHLHRAIDAAGLARVRRP